MIGSSRDTSRPRNDFKQAIHSQYFFRLWSGCQLAGAAKANVSGGRVFALG